MTDPVVSGEGYRGFQDPEDTGSELAALSFLFKALLAGNATATLVQVLTVVKPATLGFSGVVSVQPLVQQVDGVGNAHDHGPLYNLPYFQLQGGTNAVIIPPVKGDLGVAVFCDHDVSNVVATGQASPPGSRRRFDMSDGVYFGAFPLFGPAATQYLEFLPDGGGITMVSPAKITINGVTIDPQGNVVAPGNITGVQTGGGKIDLDHTHGGVQAGGSNTTKPNAGT